MIRRLELKDVEEVALSIPGLCKIAYDMDIKHNIPYHINLVNQAVTTRCSYVSEVDGIIDGVALVIPTNHLWDPSIKMLQVFAVYAYPGSNKLVGGRLFSNMKGAMKEQLERNAFQRAHMSSNDKTGIVLEKRGFIPMEIIHEMEV